MIDFVLVFLPILVFTEAVAIVFLYNKATREKKHGIKAELHVFHKNENDITIDLVSVPPIEDLLEEKMFLTIVVHHDENGNISKK